jgi:hypothetical protein
MLANTSSERHRGGYSIFFPEGEGYSTVTAVVASISMRGNFETMVGVAFTASSSVGFFRPQGYVTRTTGRFAAERSEASGRRPDNVSALSAATAGASPVNVS